MFDSIKTPSYFYPRQAGGHSRRRRRWTFGGSTTAGPASTTTTSPLVSNRSSTSAGVGVGCAAASSSASDPLYNVTYLHLDSPPPPPPKPLSPSNEESFAGHVPSPASAAASVGRTSPPIYWRSTLVISWTKDGEQVLLPGKRTNELFWKLAADDHSC